MKKIILTERQYKLIISEEASNNEEIRQGAVGDPYQYKKVKASSGIKYFYAKKGNNDWTEQTNQVGIDSIKKLIFPEDSNASSNTSSTSSNKSTDSSTTTSDSKNVSKETTSTSGKIDAIFVAGLEGDVNEQGQLQRLKNGLGNKNIASFKYNAPTSLINKVLESNPNIPIFLFSAGVGKSYELSMNKNVNKNKLYIVEPAGIYAGIANVVKAAVTNGVPAQNVFYHTAIYNNVDYSKSYGKGIVDNATDLGVSNHFDALEKLGELKSNVV